jgi:hypothetical protein
MQSSAKTGKSHSLSILGGVKRDYARIRDAGSWRIARLQRDSARASRS